MTPELSRLVRVDTIGTTPRQESVAATRAERTVVAARFDLLTLDHLTADLTTVRDLGGIHVTGRMAATGTQACAVSAEPVAFILDEPIDLRFSDAAVSDGDEVELTDGDLDVLPLDGDGLDLGEVVAQTLGLALDPYPRAADDVVAVAAHHVISEAEAAEIAAADKARANPFAVLRRPS